MTHINVQRSLIDRLHQRYLANTKVTQKYLDLIQIGPSYCSSHAQLGDQHFFLPLNKTNLLKFINEEKPPAQRRVLSFNYMRTSKTRFIGDNQTALNSFILDAVLANKNETNTRDGGFLKKNTKILSALDIQMIAKKYNAHLATQPQSLQHKYFDEIKLEKHIKKISGTIIHQHNTFLELNTDVKSKFLQLQSSVQFAIKKIQYNSFSKGSDWNGSTHEHEKETLRNYFMKTHAYAHDHPEHLESILQIEFTKNSPGNMTDNGGHFKLSQKLNIEGEDLSRIYHSVIKSRVTGKTYRLLNRLHTSEVKRFKLNLNKDQTRNGSPFKAVLGEGAYGKVRFAESESESGTILTVKKFKDRSNSGRDVRSIAQLEFATTQVFRDSPGATYRINVPKDLIHAKTINKVTGKLQNASYMIMDYAEMGDGVHYYKHFKKADDRSFNQYRQNLPQMLYDYIAAVRQVHRHGIIHHDIKPDNFLHFLSGIKMTDFGHARPYSDPTKLIFGTTPYNAPEMYQRSTNTLDPFKLDSFALGMTLLELKLMTLPNVYKGAHLNINGDPITLTFYKGDDYGNVVDYKPQAHAHNSCNGTRDTASLPGNTLDEVIAKLLDVNPKTRILPSEAVKLPFFTNMRTYD